ncbi:MAG: GNAT family N-acetyltransferase [Caldilineaceae bacterium]
MTPPLQIQVIPRDQLSLIQKEEIRQLCTRVYEEDFSDFWGTFADSTHVLGYVGDQLVSHAAWVLRWLQPEGYSPLRTAYVEAVATDVEHQRHGYATLTMQHLQAEIVDYELGGLSENPDVRHWYARLGWESWQGPLSIRTEQGLLATPDDHCMILRLPPTPPIQLTSPLSAEWRPGELW